MGKIRKKNFNPLNKFKTKINTKKIISNSPKNTNLKNKNKFE